MYKRPQIPSHLPKPRVILLLRTDTQVHYQCYCGRPVLIPRNKWSPEIRDCHCVTPAIGFPRRDLVTIRFNRLTVMRWVGKHPQSGQHLWSCNCDCGQTGIIAPYNELRAGTVGSCGCNLPPLEDPAKSLRLFNGGRRPKNLEGQRFGMLLVLKQAERPAASPEPGAWWHCLCDCGNRTTIKSARLVSQKATHCGCSTSTETTRRPALDLTGLIFKRLTVIKPSSERSSRRFVMWECLCECGNTILASSNALRSGTRGSCTHCGPHHRRIEPGERFGLLTTMTHHSTVGTDSFWMCRCTCGKRIKVKTQLIFQNSSVYSCGCTPEPVKYFLAPKAQDDVPAPTPSTVLDLQASLTRSCDLVTEQP